MEPECSLPHSQVPATCPYPKPEQSSPCLPNPLPEIHLKIILPSKPRSSKWSLSLRFPYQHHVYTSPLPIRVTCPAHLILLYLITRITSICNVLEIKPLFMSDPSVSSLILKKRKGPAHQRLCYFMNIRCRKKFKNRGAVNVILFIFYLYIKNFINKKTRHFNM